MPPRALPFPLTTTHDAVLHGVDKYGGRIVADLRLADGLDLADVLVAEHFAIRVGWPQPHARTAVASTGRQHVTTATATSTAAPVAFDRTP